jgi:hypothetical protein
LIAMLLWFIVGLGLDQYTGPVPYLYPTICNAGVFVAGLGFCSFWLSFLSFPFPFRI